MFRSRNAIILVTLAMITNLAAAQNNGNNNNNNVGGIRIDADGVVSMAIQHDRGGKLDKRRKAALAKLALPGDISQPSDARCVSLAKLDVECAAILADEKPLPPEMRFLAGLTRIDDFLVDPETNDLILCGPAEPFAADDSGRTIGLESGRPVLQLDDLVVALRSVERSEVGCSIDPVPERLANLQAFLRQNSTPATLDVVAQRYQRMKAILGNHDVRIFGVPADSHFARGLVEADHRMKVLALGLENPGVKGFKSHLSQAGAGNALQRWWFVPLYDQIARTEDGLAFSFAGQRAQLLGEDELANAQGQRSKAATNAISTLAFSKQFTAKFPELAERMPIFAELQQLIDWIVLAALIQQERLDEKAGWRMELFRDASRLPHEVFPVPTETECLINTKSTAGGTIVGQLSGGVTLYPASLVREMLPLQPADPKLAERRTKALQRLTDREAWWWD